MPVSAADTLRRARARSRLSQSDLARRAGVAQSVISAYESGRRDPSVATLARLIAATGHELDLALIPVPDRALGLPASPLGRRLRQRRTAILRAVEGRGATNVRVFGSVARGDDGEASDVDLLVDVGPETSLLDLIGLERELAGLIGAPVDVVPADALKPRLRDEVLREAVPL